ncbi:hypothetical protein M2158_001079 [Streptomyces sp. SAI-144]|uniref:helix-turn-helix transcriptional regulator n=1 Tax=Streptomyces sp. SAI-144 TaxID=2940544 RepID=UPI002476A782|nr:DNA-binding protein [Streptomyces sp. SAI-144]MDH6432602.1 hypothetical protein [Streptomyces sp. SAI-144]
MSDRDTAQPDDFLTPKQVAAEYPALGSTQTLAQRRWMGQGPDYIKTSPGRAGRILYRRSAIERWLENCTVSPRSAV